MALEVAAGDQPDPEARGPAMHLHELVHQQRGSFKERKMKEDNNNECKCKVKVK